jgi:hypothetical protein
MSKKDESILDLLAVSRWWISVGLSGFSFLVLGFILPSIPFQQNGSMDMTPVILKSFANSGRMLAPIVAMVLLMPLPISLLNSWRNGEFSINRSPSRLYGI